MKIDYLENKNGDRIDLNKFTVLVGPNNAGKSRTLRDIHEHFVKGQNARPIIMTKIGTSKPNTLEDVLNDLRIEDHPNSIGIKRIMGVGSKLTEREQINYNPEQFERQFKQSTDSSFTFGNVAKFRITFLDADSRLNVAERSTSHNPYDEGPQNLLQALYESEETEIELKKAFNSSFNMDLHLDSAGNQLCLRIAKEFEEIPENPRKAVKILRKYQILDDQGDGYKSFIGVVLSLLLSKDRVILLDEPEAFLHPAQARQLGFWIAEHSNEIDSQIIVATHNSNFLAGILSSDQTVDIYRLNRKKEETKFHLMPAEATESLAKSPLLSSQRILDSIFHKGVIVCEADADRAVYQAVATKCFDNNQFVFIHAHNKQTIPKVTELLTDASIPVCAISDLDLINDEALIKLVELMGADEEMTDKVKAQQKDLMAEIVNAENVELLENLKKEIGIFLEQLENDKHTLSGAKGALGRLKKDASDWKIIKIHGIDAFSEEKKKIADDLIDEMKTLGLFITPIGELEGWMNLETTQKNKWIVKALQKIHNGNTSKELQDFVNEVLQFFDK